MPNLKDIVRNRIMNEMLRPVKEQQPEEDTWMVMVIDSLSMRIISSACRNRDIMDEGISLVENIELSRQPMRDMDVIYFLTPTVDSVNRLIADYRDKKAPQYNNVHLFFTRGISNALLDKIKMANVVKYIKTFKELNLEFLSLEQQCFTLDSPDTLEILFSPDSKDAIDEQHKIAKQIVTLCASLGEYPLIRYGMTHPLGATIAKITQQKLDEFCKNNPSFSKNGDRERATLIIMDRSTDPVSPLLHEYTYQAMVHDLLPIDNDRYMSEYKTKSGEVTTKDVLLNETDPQWQILRHKHIADSAPYLDQKLKALQADNAAAVKISNNQKEKMSADELSDALKSMPNFKEQMERYGLHINIHGTLFKKYADMKLESISEQEQNMAMGTDSDGNKVTKFVEPLKELFNSDISSEDRMRLLMIYIITQEGIKDTDRKMLMQAAGLGNDEEKALLNLFYLGVTLSKGTKASAKKKNNKKSNKNEDMNDYSVTSRFAPVVKRVAEEFVEGTLSEEEFPFVNKGAPDQGVGGSSKAPVRSQQANPSWANKNKKKKEEEEVVMVGPRLILFMVGGMTYSEMRSGYEITNAYHKEVLVGGTAVLTPQRYIAALKKMKGNDDPF